MSKCTKKLKIYKVLIIHKTGCDAKMHHSLFAYNINVITHIMLTAIK